MEKPRECTLPRLVAKHNKKKRDKLASKILLALIEKRSASTQPVELASHAYQIADALMTEGRKL